MLTLAEVTLVALKVPVVVVEALKLPVVVVEALKLPAVKPVPTAKTPVTITPPTPSDAITSFTAAKALLENGSVKANPEATNSPARRLLTFFFSK